MQTNGQKAVAAIKAWRAEHPQDKLDWDHVAKLIDAALVNPRTMQKPTREWLEEMRRDPANEGLDVDRELSKAQLWCNEHRKMCTRRFFVNWLNKAERVIGPGQTAIKSLPEVLGWREYFEERSAELGSPPVAASWEALTRTQREMVPDEKRARLLYEFKRDNPEAWQRRLGELRQRRNP